MWQRVQTIYLLLAIIATGVCLSLPVGTLAPETIGADINVTNYWIEYPKTGISLLTVPLSVILVATCTLGVFAIFKFHNRPLQMRMCSIAMAFDILWLAALLGYGFLLLDGEQGMTFHFSAGCILPSVALILFGMARRAIKKDEKLVKAADRIR